MKLILLGAPGSGKGTQADFIKPSLPARGVAACGDIDAALVLSPLRQRRPAFRRLVTPKPRRRRMDHARVAPGGKFRTACGYFFVFYCKYIEGKVAPLASPVGTSTASCRSTQPQRRLMGQKTNHALPIRFFPGTAPKKRLSRLNWELSPIIK